MATTQSRPRPSRGRSTRASRPRTRVSTVAAFGFLALFAAVVVPAVTAGATTTAPVAVAGHTSASAVVASVPTAPTAPTTASPTEAATGTPRTAVRASGVDANSGTADPPDAATVNGQGYWLVASDGGIFTFGDAGYYGSTGNLHLNQPIVGMAATPDGKGYWLVASDGGIFTFGDAGYYGSAPASGGQGGVVALASASNGQGYWVAGRAGGIDPFGAAPSEGSMSGKELNRPIVGFAAVPQGIPGVESPASLSITTTSLANAAVGVPYGATLAAVGGTGAYSWTGIAGFLPPGLNLTTSGTISGIPSSPGQSTFTVGVTDSTTPVALTAKVTLSITVSVAPLNVATKNLPSAVVGTPYRAALTAQGGTSPGSWALFAGALPAGLNLSSGGIITGTPTQQGSPGFTVQVVDSTSPTRQTATAALSIPVFPPSDATSASPLDSSNWSGYIEINGPFSQVMGTFSVPSLDVGTPGADQLAAWVGIDGGNGDDSLIQAGFNESPDSASPTGFVIQPWWEILPASETYIDSVALQPGDTVTVAIEQISANQWSITLTDNTNGESFTTDQTYTGPASTAEWIVEALTVNNDVSTLAPFSPDVSFSDLGFVGSDTTLQQVVMLQAASQVATPSVLTPNGFNVAYGSIPPAGP
jgi:hypothetical protein